MNFPKALPLGVIVLLLWGCGSAPTDATAPSLQPKAESPSISPQPSPSVSPQPPIPPEPSNSAIVNGRKIEVSGIWFQDGMYADNMFADPISGRIAIVETTLSNTSNESGNFLFSQFRLVDSQGRRYQEIDDSTYSMWRDEQGYQERVSDFFPGESRGDVMAFRVAPGASDFSLDWKGQSIVIPRPNNHSTASASMQEAYSDTENEPYGAEEDQLAIGQVGTLTAEKATARINLRSEPSDDIPTRRYGLVGDQVLIKDLTNASDGFTWYKVQFQESKAVGWIRGDFVTLPDNY